MSQLRSHSTRTVLAADGYTKRGMKLACYQDLKAADGKRACTMKAKPRLLQ